MPSRKMKGNHYLAMWDNQGLECIINITEHMKEVEAHEKKVMWDILKDSDFKDVSVPKIPLQQMILRARFNSQRAYEIYEFISTLTERELREEFESDPQPVVEWVRKYGHKVYSDYVPDTRKLIK